MTYTKIIDTVYGKMLVCENDTNQTNALISTGKSPDHSEIELLDALITPDDEVLDIGANFGCFSLALSKKAKKVIAYEAQRILFNMMCGSVALNSIENVYCRNAAIGKDVGFIDAPKYDYASTLSFGSIEFGGPQREPLDQKMQPSSETIGITKIDAFPCNPRLIKIDIEGMEVDALNGARETIARCKPILFIEWLKSQRGDLLNIFDEMGYSYEEVGANYLCRPK